MVKGISLSSDNSVDIGIYLTTAGCPMRTEITERVTKAVADVAGVGAIRVELDVMDDGPADRAPQVASRRFRRTRHPVRPAGFTHPRLRRSLRQGWRPEKSSVTVNLAAAMAARGLSVGVLDADILRSLDPPHASAPTPKPTQVERMIMPPVAHDVKMISIAQFTQGNTPVVWRGPMLHRALQQFLADVFWGDLDVLLLDLPPGTGDIAISVAQLIPSAEILVVTTPQQAAAEVAERAGRHRPADPPARPPASSRTCRGSNFPTAPAWTSSGEGGGQTVSDRLTKARRRQGSASRTDPAGSVRPRGRRRRDADRPQRSRFTRSHRTQGHRRQVGRPSARAGRNVARYQHGSQPVEPPHTEGRLSPIGDRRPSVCRI